jgi:serine protease Do
VLRIKFCGGGYMGIGFAIPSNLAKDIVEKLIKGGKIVRGWLGVLIQPLNTEEAESGAEKLSKLAKSLGIKDGVLIHQVIEEGPAAAAGLDAGDVILEVDGAEIKDTKEVKGVTLLQRMISNFKPGQVVKLKVVSLEKQKPRVVSVKIGELPQNEAKLIPRGGRQEEGEASDFDKLGIAVGKNKEGVKVEAVQPGSIAHQFGIKEGDIIVKIDGKDVKDVKQYQNMVKALKREANIRIKRGSTSMYLRFPIEE